MPLWTSKDMPQSIAWTCHFGYVLSPDVYTCSLEKLCFENMSGDNKFQTVRALCQPFGTEHVDQKNACPRYACCRGKKRLEQSSNVVFIIYAPDHAYHGHAVLESFPLLTQSLSWTCCFDEAYLGHAVLELFL